MRKQAGFTLIELLVGMLVTVLIMGALVSLFSSTVQSEISGFKQQEVYAQARAVVNDLKTTLRYADGAAVFYHGTNPKTPITAPKENTGAVKNIDSIEYAATIYNSSTEANESVKMTIGWKDNSKKQIKITKEVGTSSKESYFPNSTDNSVFKGDGSDFPITINKDDDSLYHINLPYKYKFALSGDKTDALITDVLKGAGSSSSDVDSSEVPPILLTAGNLTFGDGSAKIRTDEDVTLVLNATEVNKYNNGSLASSKSFSVLTNNSKITNPSGSITVVNSYNGMTLAETISKYSRISLYKKKFAYDDAATRVDLTTYPLTFTKDQIIQANNVSWESATGTVLNVYGTNAIYAKNAITIGNSNKKNDVNFSLASGETKGALIIYSKNQVNLSNLTIPKEIAVVIYAGTGLNIKNCYFGNCIVLAEGETCSIDSSDIYGMVERSGTDFSIAGSCTFGNFKGDPAAINVFDDYFGLNG